MWRAGTGASPGSPDCPDLLQHAQPLYGQDSPLYLSFFEEECRLIADRLRLGAAAGPRSEDSALLPDPPGPFTSTPVPAPTDGRAPDSGISEAAAAPAPGPAREQPRFLPQPAAGAAPGARPPARTRRAAAPQPSGGRSPRPGRARLALARARASPGPRLPSAGAGRLGSEARPLQPAGARLKGVPPARARLQHPSGALLEAKPSALPKPTPRDKLMKTAVKGVSHKQPSSRLSMAIPIVDSRSSLRPLGTVASSKRLCLSKGLSSGSATQETLCNRTQELKESGESKEQLVAVGTVLGAGKADQTWEYVESSLSSKLAPVLPSGCEDAVPAERSAGHQLSLELERVKKELERVKGELADKTAQCEAYQQTISSLQAQLRAAGVCLEDATVFKSGDLDRD